MTVLTRNSDKNDKTQIGRCARKHILSLKLMFFHVLRLKYEGLSSKLSTTMLKSG